MLLPIRGSRSCLPNDGLFEFSSPRPKFLRSFLQRRIKRRASIVAISCPVYNEQALRGIHHFRIARARLNPSRQRRGRPLDERCTRVVCRCQTGREGLYSGTRSGRKCRVRRRREGFRLGRSERRKTDRPGSPYRLFDSIKPTSTLSLSLSVSPRAPLGAEPPGIARRGARGAYTRGNPSATPARLVPCSHFKPRPVALISFR